MSAQAASSLSRNTQTMSDLRLASPEQERDAMQRIGTWREQSPEEWVARNIHRYPLWGFAEYRWPTPEFDTWVREAERWIFDIPARKELRRRFLTDEEIAQAEDYEADPF
jgi:hypothetical protein